MSFDPDATGVANGAYFGFEFSANQSALSLFSVPWDVTVSYRSGCAAAPRAIIESSTQVEIFDTDAPDVWKKGIFTIPIDENIECQGMMMRREAEKVIAHIEAGGKASDHEVALPLAVVNEACRKLHHTIYSRSIAELRHGRLVGLVGGDHSTPLGLMKAVGEHFGEFGILHIDAHMDLREAYEGFEFSHASIMYNALKISQVERLVQVSVRDFSAGEVELAAKDHRVVQFSDAELAQSEFRGVTWDEQCDDIIASLPANVYISFDIDGLEHAFCPSTGTPVPGGLTYRRAVYLITKLSRSGRRIVGFDLNEVAPNAEDEWDAIVGARLLYKLCCITLK